MASKTSAPGITEVVLRDAHQSLFATRMRIDDNSCQSLRSLIKLATGQWNPGVVLPLIPVFVFSVKTPGIVFVKLKRPCPIRHSRCFFAVRNILGYRHYADDVVEKFVERAAVNGIDVFRVFDAMNDMRNLETALRAVKQVGKHAQGTISYTVSPVHTTELWVDQARQIEDAGADSICIKDMAGLLSSYVGFDLVTRLKKAVNIPIQLHAHATTGLSTSTIMNMCRRSGH